MPGMAIYSDEPEHGSTEKRPLGVATRGGEPCNAETLGRTDTPEGLAVISEAVGLAARDVASRAEYLERRSPIGTRSGTAILH